MSGFGQQPPTTPKRGTRTMADDRTKSALRLALSTLAAALLIYTAGCSNSQSAALPAAATSPAPTGAASNPVAPSSDAASASASASAEAKASAAADKAARARAAKAAEKRAAEKRAAEKRAAEKRAAEKRAAEKRAAEKRAAEKRAAENCTPGYSPCLPPASDYDCAGGSGNGPEYVDGPVRVTGSDPYDLDRDGDGIGCDS
jgi:hypothetical protein